MEGGKIRKNPFFCPAYLFAIFPVKMCSPRRSRCGEGGANRLLLVKPPKNICKHLKMNDLQHKRCSTQSKSVKLDQTSFQLLRVNFRARFDELFGLFRQAQA